MTKSLALQFSLLSVVREKPIDRVMGNMDTLGARLRHVRELVGKTQAQMAAVLDVTNQAIQAWEKDRNKLSLDNAIAFYRETGCDLHWLLTGEGIRAELAELTVGNVAGVDNNVSGGRFIPMLAEEEIRALRSSNLDDVLSKRTDKVVMMRTHFPCGPKSFWFVINDSSNEPVYNIGDHVAVDPDGQLEPGKMIQVMDEKSGEVYVGRYRPRSVARRSAPPFDLEFVNPRYPLLRLEDLGTPRIVGIITEVAKPAQ